MVVGIAIAKRCSQQVQRTFSSDAVDNQGLRTTPWTFRDSTPLAADGLEGVDAGGSIVHVMVFYADCGLIASPVDEGTGQCSMTSMMNT